MVNRRAAIGLMVLAAVSGWAIAAQKKMLFEIYPDAKSEYRWRLKNGDGAIVATSGQGYSRKADCTKMVDNFRSDISKYSFELYDDAAKKIRFRMKSKNGQTVGAANTGYATKAEAEKVIDAIKSGTKDAEKKEIDKAK